MAEWGQMAAIFYNSLSKFYNKRKLFSINWNSIILRYAQSDKISCSKKNGDR